MSSVLNDGLKLTVSSNTGTASINLCMCVRACVHVCVRAGKEKMMEARKNGSVSSATADDI